MVSLHRLPRQAGLRPAVDIKIGFDDAHGGWFWSTEANCHLYLMHNPILLLPRPELHEMFRVDLREVERKLSIVQDREIRPIPENYRTLTTIAEVRSWVSEMRACNYTFFATDAEWHGRAYCDIKLRTVQFCWKDGHAVLIRFMDAQLQYVMDADYAEVGAALGEWLNDPSVTFCGHHASADAPVLNYWLGIDVIGRFTFDTEFAQQTVDESSELGLERGIAMKYTTLGRYDIPLVLWKKANKKLCEGGYGYIPIDILEPYALKDVDATFRAVPYIKRLLAAQGLTQYYDEIFNPFVTDMFTTFTLTGLPMDQVQMNDMRDLYNYARVRLEEKFKVAVAKESNALLLGKLVDLCGPGPGFSAYREMQAERDSAAQWEILKRAVGPQHVLTIKPFYEHWQVAPDFNIRSPDQMRRWVFQVQGHTPIKSTNKKAMGMPSMDWQKVLELPKDKQALYTPAVDKQTLQILADKSPLLDQLLNLNAVGNITKAFLKEPETFINDDGEEEVEEAGLFQWITSDQRVAGMYSATETGRPRAWVQ